MIRRPPRSTQSRSSAASDVYKRQIVIILQPDNRCKLNRAVLPYRMNKRVSVPRSRRRVADAVSIAVCSFVIGVVIAYVARIGAAVVGISVLCLLYTSDAADDLLCVDLGGRRIIKKKN